MKRWSTFFDTYLFGFLLTIVLLMPLHAFTVISLGNIFGNQELFQAWKEGALVLAGISALGIIMSDTKKRRQLLTQPANWLVLAFAAIALLVSLIAKEVSLFSFLLGIKTTLGFLILFFVVQAAEFTQIRWNVLIKTLLAISSTIGLIAIAQVYLLPADFLVRFGYGASTVPAFHLVDPAVSSIRIITTFSGPNQLGSFMVIPLIIGLWFTLKRRWVALIPFVLSSFALYHSYSRSAWIAAAIAGFITIGIWLKGWWKLLLLIPLAALMIAVGVVQSTSIDRDSVNNIRYYLLHGQYFDGKSHGSDKNRLNSALAGIEKIQEQPLGHGLGTAGPASKESAQPVVTENTYLQVGIETGIIGLLLFGGILLFTVLALTNRYTAISEAAPLIAILFGLSAANLFLHTWSDSATALVFWGLAGYVLASKPAKKGKSA